MSLVSYAASDDSNDENLSEPEMQENEEKTETKAVKLSTTNSPDLPPGEQNKAESPKNTDNNGHDKTKPKSIGSFFSSLPAPWLSTVSWASKKAGTQRKGTEQSVKITLPKLADNSDSDEEETVTKNLTSASTSQKPSGLFSLLPKPKHSVVVKENNPNRPITKISNRPLIPDSLRRKQVKKTTPQAKKNESDDDSDDDGAGGSFFSWNEQKLSTATEASTSQDTIDVGSVDNSDQVGKSYVDIPQTEKTKDVLPSTKPSISNDAMNTPSILTGKMQKETKNTRTFSKPGSVSNIDSSKHSEYLEYKNLYTYNDMQGYSQKGTSNPEDYPVGYQTNSENAGCTEAYYPYYDYYNLEQYNQAVTEQEQNYPNQQNQVQPTQDTVQETAEQFKRFLGKRGRGEESINIIDVSADDQVGSAQEWKSQYQKEDADYKPQSKKKGNLPSSQQRRKHQITYLAFQAKEKEWELRNQWSANRQTKRQTQSKYGF